MMILKFGSCVFNNMSLAYIYFVLLKSHVIFNFQSMMINGKSALTVWWCKRMYSLTSWALWRNTTSSCRRTVCWQDLHTRSNHCGWNASWRAWSRCRTPAAETLQCFLQRLLVGLVANIGRGKTGPIEEQAYPVWNFYLRLLCACSVHFQPVSCMFSRFWSCWQKLSYPCSPCLSTV